MKYGFLLILIICFLFLPEIILAQSTNNVLLEEIKAKELEIKKLEADLSKYKNILSQNQKQSKTLKNQIALIEAQIARLGADLKITRAKISKTELNIRLYYGKITEKELKIKERKAAISQSFKFLAQANDNGFLLTLLGNKKFSDFLSQNRYIINLEQGLYNNFKVLSQDKKELEELISAQKELAGDLNSLQKELQYKNNLVANQKQEKNALLRETKNQEMEYQKIISKIQIRQAEIQKEIFKLEDTLRGEVSNVPRPRPGELAWPIMGRLTQGYGPTYVTGFYNDVYKFHNGVDITFEYGTIVRASLGGVVVASGDNGHYAYGKWLAIKHNNGLTTLYAHLLSKTVSVGEILLQGQIIGYEGSTGFVTGPHLHFTVYSTNTFKTENRWFGLLPVGGSINPLNYLLQ